MDFELDEDQLRVREAVLAFARGRLNDGLIERDRAQTFPRDLWHECGRIGLQGLPVPSEYGGGGHSALTMAVALEAFGEGCRDGGLVFSVGAHLCSCVVPIWKYGSEEQKRLYLPRLVDGTWIAVHGMTEPGSGSDAFSMATRAVPHGDGFRLNGTKTFASNGPVADLALVFAMTDRGKGFFGGATAFLIEKGTAGFRSSGSFEKLGLRTSPMGELVLDDVDIGPESVLGGVGGGAAVFSRGMDWERVGLFASHVGAMDRLLQTAVAHARRRTQFGQTIGKFQAVAHRIADMKVRLEAARLLLYKAAWCLDRGKGATAEAAMAKLFVSEALVEAAIGTIQVLGGSGYMVESEVERALRDAVGSTLYSGTSEIQRSLIARALGL